MNRSASTPEDRVERLLELLPRVPYVACEPLHGLGIPPEVSLYAQAKNDPAFGRRFLDIFVELGRPLPAEVHEPELLRAYSRLRFGDPDSDVQAALALEEPCQKPRRILVRCFLVLAEYSYSEIAKKTGLSEEAVRIYQALFWAVRGRDRIFINSLIFPESRQCELRAGYEGDVDFGDLCLRAAVRHGIGVVEELLGSTNPRRVGAPPLTRFLTNTNMKSKLDQLSESFMAQVLENANYLGKMGLLNQNLPAFKDALAVARLLASRKVRQGEDTSVRQLAGVSALAITQSLSRGMAELERRLEALARNQIGTEASVDGELKHQHSVSTQSTAQPDQFKAAA